MENKEQNITVTCDGKVVFKGTLPDATTLDEFLEIFLLFIKKKNL